jgi:cell wall-associated NlpC family hydrolase
VENKEKEGTYESVSYNWGGFDTILEYNKKILSKIKAGNVNLKQSPLLSCAAGVDCSGFISRSWGFTGKLGTYDIASD